jgi:predicted DNA repair protein MutK
MIAPEFGYESLTLGIAGLPQGANTPAAGAVIHHLAVIASEAKQSRADRALPIEIASSLRSSQ